MTIKREGHIIMLKADLAEEADRSKLLVMASVNDRLSRIEGANSTECVRQMFRDYDAEIAGRPCRHPEQATLGLLIEDYPD